MTEANSSATNVFGGPLERIQKARAFFGRFGQHIQMISRVDGGKMLHTSVWFMLVRILQLTTLFLPLKVLIVMASDRVPVYFDKLTQYLTVEQLLAALIMLVPISFVFHILCNIIAGRLNDKSVLLVSNDDAIQTGLCVPEKRVEEYHRQISAALTEMNLICVSTLLVFIIDYLLAILLLILVFINYLYFESLNEKYPSKTRAPKVNLHRNQIVEYVVACNFLFIFFGLMIAAKYSLIGIFSAVLALLMSRMIFQSMQRLVKHTYMIKGISDQGIEQERIRNLKKTPVTPGQT